MNSLVENQRKFFLTNATKSVAFRKAQLKKLKQVILENEVALHQAIYDDFKKSEFECYATEIGLVLKDITDTLSHLDDWAKTKRVQTNLINFPASSYIVPEPLGVTLVIGAWNYPYLLSLAPAIAAMAAGNTVVIKPSELPANTSHILAKIINQNFDANYLTVVEGAVNETTQLLEQKWDKIFFTGSTHVGKIVAAAAAKNLTPTTLELGGKSPAIVTPSCNLKMTVKRLVWSKFINAGQTCIAPDYLLVHESIHQKFLELAKAEIEKAQYSVENNNYVQIIDERNMQRLVKMLDSKKVVVGGRYDIATRHFEPTILSGVAWTDAAMQQEIFGPIWPIISYSNLNEAIEKVKTFSKPLSCYVFTSNKGEKQKILDELSFGGGCINDSIMHISNSHLPFGGVGDSGMGTYHGEAGFKTFSHYKSILDKPTWFELNLKYPTYTSFKFKLIKKLMKLG
jgi:aldehyde dehydrogenase (NAD+)